MRTILIALLMGSTFTFNAHAVDHDEIVKTRLRVEPSASGCTFDRSVSEAVRVGSETIAGYFSVNCSEHSKPYRLTTHLSPLAKLYVSGGRHFRLKWYIKPYGETCEGNRIYDNATDFHSGSRNIDLIGLSGVTRWSYCMQVTPSRGASLGADEPWPVHGELEVSAIDAERGNLLPADASMVSVNFDNNSAVLSEEEKRLLNGILMNVGGPGRVQIQLHAHASDVGAQQYNHDLSLMRLKSVRDWFIKEGGVSFRDTWGQAWGADRPFAIKAFDGNEDEKNRRVDIVFLPKEDGKVSVTESAALKARPVFEEERGQPR